MKQNSFEQVCSQVLNNQEKKHTIGTLAEKTIHAVLKAYYAPDSNYCEQKVTDSGYIADIFYDSQIIEIQTQNFRKLRRKLDAFLPNYDVTIVYPVIYKKQICWIDPNTGEIVSKRKSSKTGTQYAIFKELFWIKEYLHSPRLHFRIVLLETEEYRLLDGYGVDKKRRATKLDQIPISLKKEIEIQTVKDYSCFLPHTLPKEFTVKDYQSICKIPLKSAGNVIQILREIDLIEQITKRGKAYVYQKKSN